MKLSLSNLPELWALLQQTVELAEVLWSGYVKAGDAKKEWVVDLINDKVNIPWLNESMEGRLISFLVDLAASALPKK
jgi:hypothetical protein